MFFVFPKSFNSCSRSNLIFKFKFIRLNESKLRSPMTKVRANGAKNVNVFKFQKWIYFKDFPAQKFIKPIFSNWVSFFKRSLNHILLPKI